MRHCKLGMVYIVHAPSTFTQHYTTSVFTAHEGPWKKQNCMIEQSFMRAKTKQTQFNSNWTYSANYEMSSYKRKVKIHIYWKSDVMIQSNSLWMEILTETKWNIFRYVNSLISIQITCLCMLDLLYVICIHHWWILITVAILIYVFLLSVQNSGI